MPNIDIKTVKSFGDEWNRFDQKLMSDLESKRIFDEYFSIFPWSKLPENSEGFDMGCGSGRWAKWVAPNVGKLHCIDPSDAIQVARESLTNFDNLVFHQASVDSECLPLKSQDFGYSLGVLHHIPDTTAAICSCVNLLKPGAPFLLYLYYSFENRPYWFKFLWYCSDFARRFISLLPPKIKQFITDIIALFVYFPLSLISFVVEKAGFEVSMIPLSYYRNHTFYTMRTDARDRFGTPLEKRFNKTQISNMMEAAGLIDIEFSEGLPYWCAVGFRR